jgi:Rrf2 family protein
MSGLVRFSEAASLALHTMALLAAEPARARPVREIAEALPASAEHLAKVMQRLGRAGLVTSSRGPGGGFALARAPREITLLEVYEAIDGVLDAGGCLLGARVCTGPCMFGEAVHQANAALQQRLARTRLPEAAAAFGPAKTKSPKRHPTN